MYIVTMGTKYYNSVNYFESKEIAEAFALEKLEEYKEYKEFRYSEPFSICVAEVLQTLNFTPEEG